MFGDNFMDIQGRWIYRYLLLSYLASSIIIILTLSTSFIKSSFYDAEYLLPQNEGNVTQSKLTSSYGMFDSHFTGTFTAEIYIDNDNNNEVICNWSSTTSSKEWIQNVQGLSLSSLDTSIIFYFLALISCSLSIGITFYSGMVKDVSKASHNIRITSILHGVGICFFIGGFQIWNSWFLSSDKYVYFLEYYADLSNLQCTSSTGDDEDNDYIQSFISNLQKGVSSSSQSEWIDIETYNLNCPVSSLSTCIPSVYGGTAFTCAQILIFFSIINLVPKLYLRYRLSKSIQTPLLKLDNGVDSNSSTF